jgi:AcrR family transcriptional regulator
MATKPATASPRRTPVRTETPRLSRDDWLDAAFQAVVEGGFDQVRVLLLAAALGVTRGSFYWHFVDHADLVSALLARWRARETEIGLGLAAQSTDDPQADLDHLLEAALAHGGTDLENMRFELALRGLGRRDAAVAQMLLEVDQQRMALFESKFLRLTGDPKTAADLAALFYLAIVGSNQALSRPNNPPQTKHYLKGLIAGYLIRGQTAAGVSPAPGRSRPGVTVSADR